MQLSRKLQDTDSPILSIKARINYHMYQHFLLVIFAHVMSYITMT